MEIKPEEYNDYLKEQYLNIREASELLEISEDELRDMVDQQQIPAHNIAGVFLRLKKKDIENLKNKWRIQRELFPEPEPYFAHHNVVKTATVFDKVRDFWYFNDFYVLCSVLIVALLYFIISNQ